MASLMEGLEAFAENLRLPDLVESTGSFLDDLVGAFDDDEVLGAGSPTGSDAVKPPFVDLRASRGLRVKFDIKGPEDAPKLMYIPGVTDDLRKTLSIRHFDAFAKKFRTLTCDLRNQGETAPFTTEEYVPLETYVEDLIALADKVYGPDTAFHIAGLSFGAAIALLMARLHPDRVQSVAVLAGGYFEPQRSHVGSLQPGGEALFGKEWKWIKTISSYTTVTTEKRCEQMLYYADVRRNDSAYRQKMLPSFEWCLNNFVRSESITVMKSPRSAKELGNGVLVQQTALYAEGTEQVEDIRTPTIIIHGRHDGMHTVDRAVSLKERMRDAMLVILEDQGHVIVTAAVDTAAGFMHPQIIVNPCLQNRRAWSFERATSALEEISIAYLQESCQRKLDAVFDKPELTENEKEAECRQTCLQVRKLILERLDQSCSDAAPADDDEEHHRVLDLMSRRLDALETMAVADRKKAHEKRVSDVNAKARSQMYMQRSMVDAKLDPEDYLRRSLQMQDEIKKSMVMPMPVPTGYSEANSGDPEDYVRRLVQMRSQQKEQQQKASWWMFGTGNEEVDTEDYIRRSLQMKTEEAGDPEDYFRRALQMNGQVRGH